MSKEAENQKEVNTRTKKKLSVETLDLLKKIENLLIKTNRDKIEVAEFNKTISKKQRDDIRKYNRKIIEETVEQGKRFKSAKKETQHWKDSDDSTDIKKTVI